MYTFCINRSLNLIHLLDDIAPDLHVLLRSSNTAYHVWQLQQSHENMCEEPHFLIIKTCDLRGAKLFKRGANAYLKETLEVASLLRSKRMGQDIIGAHKGERWPFYRVPTRDRFDNVPAS